MRGSLCGSVLIPPSYNGAMTDYRIRLAPQGWEFAAAPGQTVLQAAEAAGLVLPSSCRNGTCRTCACMAREGQVAYRIEWPGLLREERAEGWILPCVAVAQSDLVLEVPAARKG